MRSAEVQRVRANERTALLEQPRWRQHVGLVGSLVASLCWECSTRIVSPLTAVADASTREAIGPWIRHGVLLDGTGRGRHPAGEHHPSENDGTCAIVRDEHVQKSLTGARPSDP